MSVDQKSLLGSQQALASGDVVYSTWMSIADQPWLADHVIHGTIVVPGATYASMVMISTGLPARLQQILFHEPILLNKLDEREVQLIVHTAEDGSAGSVLHFEVHSRSSEDPDARWARNASGTIVTGDQVDDTDLTPINSLESMLENLKSIPVQQLFEGFAQLDLKWGPTWQTSLAAIWIGVNEALGEIVMGDALAEYVGTEPIHPVILDLCTGVAGAAIFATNIDSQELGLYLPLRYEQVWLRRRMPTRFYCRARWRDSGHASQETQAFDLDFFDPTGQPLGGIQGFTVKRAPREALLRGLWTDSEQLIYQQTWRELPPVEAANTVSVPASWLLVGLDPDLEDVVGNHLTVLGHRATRVGFGAPEEASDRDRLLIGRQGPRDWDAVLQQAEARSIGPIRGIVWHAIDEPLEDDRSGEEVLLQLNRDAGGIVELIQALQRRGVQALPQGLWIVTRQGVGAEVSEQVHPLHAALWGLGRTIAVEQPPLRCLLVDRDSNPESAIVLRDWLLSGSTEPQLAIRRGKTFVPRMMPRARSGQLSLPMSQDFRLDPSERGSLDKLRLVSEEIPPPDRGYVQVQVEAGGLNFRDVLNVLGLYPGDPGPLGGELAGTITAIGADVPSFQPGQRVFGFGPGTFASRVNVPYLLLALVPDEIGTVDAATTPAGALTAELAFQWARPLRGERVLIHAATGGVGLAAVQIAKNLGAEVYATASQPKQEFLRRLGVQHIYDSRSTAFADQILADTNGNGVDVVLNSLTSEGYIAATLRATVPGGRFVEIAKRDIWTAEQMTAARPDLGYHILALDDLMQHDPRRIGELLANLAAQLHRHELQPLPKQVYPLTEAKAAFRCMQHARHIGKILLSLPRGLALRSDRTYLITGGLGALGLRAAEHLAQQGTKHLVLTSRRQPDALAQKMIDEMTSRHGCQVHVFSADLGQEDQVAQLLERIATELPPLAGLIHAAGVLDDGLLGKQSWERFQTVLAPKVLGAWHLHRLTRQLDLDFFILYSSASSVLGSPGQANYATANALLDGLAAYRRSRGLSGTSVNWGPWGEAGMATRGAAQTNLAKQGILQLKPSAALAALSYLIRNGTTQATVIKANWHVTAKLLGAHRPPLLEYVLPKPASPISSDGALLSVLQRTPQSQRSEFLTEHLQHELRQILGLAQLPDSESRFSELGMDSLMAVELSNQLHAQFGSAFTLSSTVAFDYPNIRALAGYLASQTETIATAPEPAEIKSTAELPSSVSGLNRSVEALVANFGAFRELGLNLVLNGVPEPSATPGVDSVVRQALLRQEADRVCQEILADAALDQGIRIEARVVQHSRQPHALLTGGTGYVGGFLLKELLKTGIDVTCLVRCVDQQAGQARIAANLKEMNIWDAAAMERVHVVPCDLEQPRLGLSPQVYGELAERTDRVFHCAAAVRFWSAYNQLREANVTATRQMIEFLTTGVPKTLHFVSTTAVFLAPDYWQRPLVMESEFPESPRGLVFGYGQSKWTAESLVRQAQSRGIPTVVYRPGAILGDSQSGFWSPRDLSTQFMAISLATKTISETGRILDGLPVDIVARFITACSQEPSSPGQTYHLVHPHPVTVTQCSELLMKHGIQLSCIPRDDWNNRFLGQGSLEAGAWRTLFELRGTGVEFSIMECLRRLPTFATTNFQQKLNNFEIPCPDFEQLVEQDWLRGIRLS